MKALVLRLLGLLMCSPVQAVGYIAVSGSTWYGLALCYVPIAVGWVGLSYRPILDVIADRDPPRHDLSAKGAVLGATLAFAAFLVFTPHDIDRTKLTAVFIAGSTLYYAFGKLGCIVIGCCGAISVSSPIPLPAGEAAGSAFVASLAIGSLFVSMELRLAIFIALAFAFGALRVFSRYARGMELRRAFLQQDSVAMTLVALFSFATMAH